jgi:hypothetical protein
MDNMSQETDPPDARLDAPTAEEVESLELFRRSPHPYLRRKNEIRKDSLEEETIHEAENGATKMNGTEGTREQGDQDNGTKSRMNTSNRTKPRSNHSNRAIPDADGRKRRKILGHSQSQSPSESGTEADDEGYSFVKALPPPPLRLHKGLRDRGATGHGGPSPLLTPTQIDDEGRKLTNDYFSEQRKGTRRGEAPLTDDDARAARQKYLQRRRNELVRRTTETALLAGIGFLAVSGCGCWGKLLGWHRGRTLISVYVAIC